MILPVIIENQFRKCQYGVARFRLAVDLFLENLVKPQSGHMD